MKVPCEPREKLEISASENESDFSEDSQKCSGRLGKWWKNFYSQGTLFIGEGGGVVSRTRLDSTVAKFPEDVCPLRRSEGDVFLPKFKGFHGNRSLESTHFPEGLVLGNLVKPCHPRNVELSKFIKQVREAAVRERYRFMKKGWRRESCWVSDVSPIYCGKHENNGRMRPLYSNCQSVSGCTNITKVWN
jgi:hypothetical protein